MSSRVSSIGGMMQTLRPSTSPEASLNWLKYLALLAALAVLVYAYPILWGNRRRRCACRGVLVLCVAEGRWRLRRLPQDRRWTIERDADEFHRGESPFKRPDVCQPSLI